MGITVKDKVEQFKRDCKSIGYYQKVIVSCEEEIERLDKILTRIPMEVKQVEYCSKKGLILEQDIVVQELHEYEKRIKDIYEKLDRIKDTIDKDMVMDAFILGKYYKQLINKYHFNDSSAFYRHINKVIEKIV